MKKYNFLFKPLFFIFSLLFATWLVIKIERIKPSDFNMEEARTGQAPAPCNKIKVKVELKKLFSIYASGKLSSLEFDRRLTMLLDTIKVN